MTKSFKTIIVAIGLVLFGTGLAVGTTVGYMLPGPVIYTHVTTEVVLEPPVGGQLPGVAETVIVVAGTNHLPNDRLVHRGNWSYADAAKLIQIANQIDARHYISFGYYECFEQGGVCINYRTLAFHLDESKVTEFWQEYENRFGPLGD